MNLLAELVLFFIYFFIYMLALALVVAIYVLQGLGLMNMLRAVGYKKPWFAWVPVVNALAIGDLADLYDNGKPKKGFGKKLMALMIAELAVFVLIIVLAFVVGVLTAACAGDGVFVVIVFLVLAYLALFGIMIPYSIYYYMSLWNIYCIFAPSSSVILLLLSIFVSDATPIAIFALRNKTPQNLRVEDNKIAVPEPPYNYDVNDGK